LELVCYPDKLSLAGEASRNLTVNPTQVKRKRGGQKGNRNACKHGFYSATSRLPRCPSPLTRREGCHLGFGTRALFVIWAWFVIWALAFELYLSFASLRQSASPRLAIIKGKPTKRIVRILTTKSAAGSHLTYEKELLNSRKNSNSYKTNHPGKGNNGGLGGLMEDPISIQIPILFAYMPGMRLWCSSPFSCLPTKVWGKVDSVSPPQLGRRVRALQAGCQLQCVLLLYLLMSRF